MMVTGLPERRLHQRFLSRYPVEATRVLEGMGAELMAEVLQRQPVREAVRVWEYLSPPAAAAALEGMQGEAAVDVIRAMDPNRGAAVLAVMSSELREMILERLPARVSAELRHVMSYPVDSAGALMDVRVHYYSGDMTAEDALSRLRSGERRDTRAIFIVDEENRLRGVVDVQDLALSDPEDRLGDLMHTVSIHVDAMATRESVVELFDKQQVSDVPVIDFDGRLLGVIHQNTLIRESRAESTADIQTMVGVSKEERALSGVGFVVRKRLPWLQINLATAFLAASVVGLFESTIAKYTALAVLMPVVAGQSGNTGAQALAVTLRGLALREIQVRHWPRMLYKEINAGFWNGLAVAATTAAGVYIWSHSPGLCLIIVLSMIVSMVIAGIAGAVIPILMEAAGQDPAHSSTIFLTTVTDVTGFMSFLGIATLLSGML